MRAKGERQRKSPAKHAEIVCEVERNGQLDVGGDRGTEETRRPECQRDGQRSRDEPQRRAFGQQLPHHSPASRTQGQTDRNLAAAGGRPRQKQVRDVAARDGQMSPDAHTASVEIPRTCSSPP